MSDRRRLLMAISNTGKWLPYSFEYLYHDLIPQKLPTFNLWDEQWEKGRIDITDGSLVVDNDRIRSVNYIIVSPKTTYYAKTPYTISLFFYDNDYKYITYQNVGGGTTFTPPTNTRFMKFFVSTSYGTTYNNDICINVSSSQNGTYKPYSPKNVKDKLKLATIYGNSVVENQLVQNGDFSNGTTGWGPNSGAGNFSTMSVSNGVLTQTFSGTPDAGYKSGLISQSGYRFNTYNNHYYLAHCRFKASISCLAQIYTESTGYFTYQNVSANQWISYSQIKKATQDKTNDYFVINITDATTLSNGDTLEFAEMELIDLTKEFPFDTPTSLTDNRVQAILNRGYIPHNTGELKNTDIGEFESEPYNLFDGQLEIGGFDNVNTYNCHSKNFIKVVSGKTYAFDNGTFTSSANFGFYYRQYDEYFNLLVGTTAIYGTINENNKQFTFTPVSGAKYIKFFIFLADYNFTNNFPTTLSIHLSGTRVGYEPYDFGMSGAKSLLEKQNVPYSYGSSAVNVSFYPLQDGSFHYWGATASIKNCRRIANHKYFLYAKVSNATTYSWSYIGIWDTYSTGYEGNRQVPNQTGDDFYCIISPTTGVENGVPTLQFGGTNNTELTCQAMCILDLTELGLDSLTDTQVYAKIKGYLSALANGDRLGIIPFKYQGSGVGSSKDSLEITNTDYVFTKNIGSVDLGTLEWLYGAGNNANVFYTTSNIGAQSVSSNEKANCLCSKYQTYIYNALSSNLNIGIAIDTNGKPRVYDSAYNNATTFKTAMSGVMLEYQLATPQTITIPRKHLGVVELSTLNWYNEDNVAGRWKTESLRGIAKGAASSSSLGNAVINKYLTITHSQTYNGNIGVSVATDGDIRIFDNSYANLNDFKASLVGQYLFYETNSEVTDIPTELLIQAGGTFTSNMFSWVENQSFKSYISPNPTTNNSLTFTRNTDTQSITINGTASALTQQGFGGSNPLTANHYYLVYCDKQPSGVALLDMNGTMGSNAMSGYIGKPTSNISFSPRFDIQSGTQLNNVELNVILIDLTLAFGSGNEPTSINDPRIQKILGMGYIPTNTSGTYKSVDTEVLPNVDTKIKCK